MLMMLLLLWIRFRISVGSSVIERSERVKRKNFVGCEFKDEVLGWVNLVERSEKAFLENTLGRG